MIFHEIYGTYYTIISQLLAQAAEGTLTKEELYTTVRERGFAESSLAASRSDASILFSKASARTPQRSETRTPPL